MQAVTLHYLTTPAEATGLRLKEAGVTDTIVRPPRLNLWHNVTAADLSAAVAQVVDAAGGTRPHAATFCFSGVVPRLNPWSATEAEWQVFVVNLARFANAAKTAGIVGFALDSEVYQEAVATGVGAWAGSPKMQQRGKDYRQALQGLAASTYLPFMSPWAPITTTNINNGMADRAEGFFAFWRGVGLANLSVLWEDRYGWDGTGTAGADFQRWLRVHFRSPHGPLPVMTAKKKLAALDKQLKGPLPHFACGFQLTAANLPKLVSALAGRKALGGAWLYPGGERLLASTEICARVRRCVG